MRLPTDRGTGIGAAERETAYRAEQRAEASAAEPGFTQSRAGMSGSSQAASATFAGFYIDADGNGYKRWILGESKFSEPWRFGPNSERE